MEVQLVVLEGMKEQREELSAEHATQDAHGKEETPSSIEPALPIEAEATTGNDTVQVRMSEEVLSPGME